MNNSNLLDIVAFSPKSLQSPTAWMGHLPFAAWVIREVSPKIFVELGTHSGNSYFSFCQSVDEARLSTLCYAVDTWQGDEHAGCYGNEIFSKVNAYHQEHYARFSQLLRMTFDDAVTHFADESIDLLHIDGLHTYDAVRHDFETWLPKLAPGAVVLFHDTNVRERNFGVWKFWAELQAIYPNHLEFVHSHGLGVLQLDNAPPHRILRWLQSEAPDKRMLKNHFAALGARQLERFDLFESREEIANLDKALVEREGEITSLKQALVERDGEITGLNQAVADLNCTITAIRRSTSWRLTAPIRLIGLHARKFKSALHALHAQSSKVMRKAWYGLPLYAKIRERLKSKKICVTPFFYNFWRGYKDIELANSAFADESLDCYSVGPAQYVPRLTSDTPDFEKAARVIAFYLPQFHPIPENDGWWGKDFTEWTNVKSAKPQFEGHYQPHVPDDFLGYYDLRDSNVMRKQIELAKQYGIEGFCFYTYWFAGHRLLETPIDNYLDDPSLELPFCLCWANENWSRRWDGLDQDLLMEQRYSPEDDVAFITHMSKYLRDSRYIRIEGKPLLIVYRPNLLPSMEKTADRWRNWCRNNELGEIYIAYVQSFEKRAPADYGLDAAIEFPPNNSSPPEINKRSPSLSPDFSGEIYDGRIFLKRAENYEVPTYPLFRGVCPSWDNTARQKSRSTVFANFSPDLFQCWLIRAFEETRRSIQKPERRLVFINAWNEWAEGAHLEPDQRYGYAWLEATRLAQVRSNIIHARSELNERGHLAIVIHAYYIDVLEQLLNRLPALIKMNAVLFVSTIEEHSVVVKKMAADTAMSYEVMVFENHGRDILPFLKVLRVIEGRGFSHVLKLHTKKSLHRDDGERWCSDLYEKLLDPLLMDLILPFFNKNPKVGLIAPAGYVVKLSYYLGSNRANTESLARRLGFNGLNPEESRFIAGTMFYARSEALRPLLQVALNDHDFEKEAGQVDGTLAHAVERVIALSAEAVGMGIVSSDLLVGPGKSRGAKLEDFYSPFIRAD